MRTSSSFLFIAVLLLSVAGGPVPAGEPIHPAAFCPECWKFLVPADLDTAGRCRISGKKPVDVEAVELSWSWCRHHQAWHRKPCGQEFVPPETVTALLLPSGSESVSVRAYCPKDGRIAEPGYGGLRCPICSRPYVEAATVKRHWYWCGTQKAWRSHPCDANRTLLVCCKLRKGTVLAHSWQLPFLNASIDPAGQASLSFSGARVPEYDVKLHDGSSEGELPVHDHRIRR